MLPSASFSISDRSIITDAIYPLVYAFPLLLPPCVTVLVASIITPSPPCIPGNHAIVGFAAVLVRPCVGGSKGRVDGWLLWFTSKKNITYTNIGSFASKKYFTYLILGSMKTGFPNFFQKY